MTTDEIICAFRRKGYQVAVSMQRPNRVTVTNIRGHHRTFRTYREAYKFYFE